MICGLSMTDDKGTMLPKLDPTGVRTHDLQIMTVHGHVTEMPALATRPSVTVLGMSQIDLEMWGSQTLPDAD